jgi:hypothetical protein
VRDFLGYGTRDVQEGDGQWWALAGGSAVMLIEFAHEFSRFKEAGVVRRLIVLAAIVPSAGPFLIKVEGTKTDKPNENVDAVTNLVGEV